MKIMVARRVVKKLVDYVIGWKTLEWRVEKENLDR